MEKTSQSTYKILGIFVVIIVGYFGVYPKIGQLKEINTNLGAKKSEAASLDANLQALNTLKSQFISRTADITRLKIALPEKANPEEIFIMLQTAANIAGVSLEDVSPNAATGFSAPVSATVKGDYVSIVKFSDQLMSNTRPVKITSLNIVAVESKDKPELNGSQLSASYNLDFVIASKVIPELDGQNTTASPNI